MWTDTTRYYWTNESHAQDVNRPFPNLIATETLIRRLYLSKFANCLVTYPLKNKLAKFETYFYSNFMNF